MGDPILPYDINHLRMQDPREAKGAVISVIAKAVGKKKIIDRAYQEGKKKQRANRSRRS